METTTETTLTSNPIHVAGGLRMMAKHLLSTIDPTTAHPDRLHQVADEAEALLTDARTLVGEDQHDRELWSEINARRNAADIRTTHQVNQAAITAFG